MNLLWLLTLLEIPKIGRKTVRKILPFLRQEPVSLSDINGLINLAKMEYRRISLPSDADLISAFERAQKTIETCQRLNIEIIKFDDSAYPKKFDELQDFPLVIFVLGNSHSLMVNSVAIVGTRSPSEFGIKCSHRIAQLYARSGLAIVSGLALGCDTAAHRGCLDVSGQTVAVLASGLDSIYPEENKKLACEILERNGCLISEYAPGVLPRRSSFIERDRLQVALSNGVVVIETDLSGGTMHTASFCLEQGKPLACLSHPEVFSRHPKVAGNKSLIHDSKAIPLKDRRDIETFAHYLSN